MRLIWIVVIAFSAALVKAEKDGFGYELTVSALENLQSNDLSLDRTLGFVVTKVDQLINDQRLFKSTLFKKLDKLIDLTVPGDPRCPENATNGVYHLKPFHSSIPTFPAYCEDGWIVIHRRFNGSLDFNREWVPYREGFGDLRGEYWLGLEKMHQITRVGSYELKVLLKSFEGVEKSALYKGFKIGSELTQYQLSLEKFDGGDAGDSFMPHNGMKFSAVDRDNDLDDNDKSPCAMSLKSGWWFKGCYHTNLNGQYKKGKLKFTMAWNSINLYCLMEARMMIRRK